MSHYQYQGENLICEDLEIESITNEIETPFYCYSFRSLRDNINKYKENLKNTNSKICFALKANSNLEIIRIIAEEGFGADVVSIGEFQKALRAGISGKNIVFSGVGKTESEIEFAIKNNCFQINAESISEIKKINEISGNLNIKQNIGIRINPDVKPDTHSKITTGSIENKFGIPINDVKELFNQSNLFENINFNGLAFHIGSQIMKLEPFEEACKITNQLIKEVESNGFTIKTIDVGGGIGIDENEKFKFIEYFNLINSYFAKKDRTIIFEPGRTIIGNTSILVSKILYIKETEDKIFVVIDAGMNDFMRPALYGATHEILPILQSETKKNKVIEFVGPICETSDKFLTLDSFQNINEGDFIAISNTGAYGSSMSSNYNVRPNIAEILINKNKFSTIRKRQNLEDLISE
jgi:diaminopimelate decarboxylase